MAEDPRFTAIRAAQAAGGNPGKRIWDKMTDLERRVQTLESSAPRTQTSTGVPPNAARPGTPALDTLNGRAYWYYSGGWHYVTLT